MSERGEQEGRKVRVCNNELVSILVAEAAHLCQLPLIELAGRQLALAQSDVRPMVRTDVVICQMRQAVPFELDDTVVSVFVQRRKRVYASGHPGADSRAAKRRCARGHPQLKLGIVSLVHSRELWNHMVLEVVEKLLRDRYIALDARIAEAHRSCQHRHDGVIAAIVRKVFRIAVINLKPEVMRALGSLARERKARRARARSRVCSKVE